MESGSMEIIKVNFSNEIPEKFTGIAEFPGGSQHWYKNGKFHREDGPALIDLNGRQEWYKNGKLHREDGPAVIKSDGTKLWFFNNKQVSAMEVFDRLPDDKKEQELWNLDQWK